MGFKSSTSRTFRIFRPFPRGDSNGRFLFAVTALLLAIGTMMVASATEGQAAANGGSSWSLMLRDVLYLFLGAVAFWLMAKIDVRFLLRRANLLIYGSLLLLVVVLLHGQSASGGKRWISTGVFPLQPSELFKLTTVIFVASLVESYHQDLGHWQVLAKKLWPVIAGLVLIIIEPDIGTTSVIAMIALVILTVAGLSRRLLGRITGLGVLGILLYAMVRTYSFDRLTSFLQADSHEATSGYQLLQSRIGLGAGGPFGLGLGHSREKWGLLPNPHTDFIFTILGEEFGLLGTLLVMSLFVAFLFASVRIARKCTNDTYRLIVVGITAWIMFEATVNIASVVGWWAVTGIPLPFFSYGGTALITELAAVGLVYNIAHDRSKSADLTIRHVPMLKIRELIRRLISRLSQPQAPSSHYAPTPRRRPHSQV